MGDKHWQFVNMKLSKMTISPLTATIEHYDLLSHGLLVRFTELGKDYLLWNRPQIQSEGNCLPYNLHALLHQWKHWHIRVVLDHTGSTAG